MSEPAIQDRIERVRDLQPKAASRRWPEYQEAANLLAEEAIPLADACEQLQNKLDEFVLSACRERDQLRAQVAELTKDRERLDWLEYRPINMESFTRAAIDAAMASSRHLAWRTETPAQAAVEPASTEETK